MNSEFVGEKIRSAKSLIQRAASRLQNPRIVGAQSHPGIAGNDLVANDLRAAAEMLLTAAEDASPAGVASIFESGDQNQ